ncbi:MAG: M24 family metallopeptidase [bacterium]
MISIPAAQTALSSLGLDAWLIHDYCGSNPTLSKFITQQSHDTGRTFLIIPANGQPRLLVHTLEILNHKDSDIVVDSFVSHQDIRAWLEKNLTPHKKVAMEYSPNSDLPSVSFVDAGTLELVRSFGPEIVTSADLLQATAPTWTPANLASHHQAARALEEINAKAFDLISTSLRGDKPIDEYTVQQLIIAEMDRHKLIQDGPAIVAAGKNGRFPHYEPTKEHHSPVQKGDIVLIDLWAKPEGADGTFADITVMGFAGTTVPPEARKVFDAVRTAQKLVVERLTETWTKKETLQGWELDRIARDYITSQGYGDQFIHSTGHPIGPGDSVHAPGVGLNDISAHDTRVIIPGIGLTVEPGIYTKDFGVRLELNVYMDPEKGPVVTTHTQDDFFLLG